MENKFESGKNVLKYTTLYWVKLLITKYFRLESTTPT